MIRYARNPVAISVAAAAIVVAGSMLAAPHLKTSVPSFPSRSVERVASQSEPVQQPKLMVNVPEPAATPAPQTGLSAPLIARTASVSMIVPNVDRAIAASARVAREDGGDVFALDSSNDGTAGENATMTVRIPAAGFDKSLARLARIGTVRSRSIKAEDLTANITDSSARLINLRRTESDIRKIMDRSGSVSQIMRAENRLSDVREQIETLEAEVKSMRTRVVYSTIDVEFVPQVQKVVPDRTVGARLRTNANRAWKSLTDVTIALLSAIIWAAVFLPYALAAVGSIAVLRLILRRYRAQHRTLSS